MVLRLGSKDLSQTKDRVVFIDANILIYLYSDPRHHYAYQYSKIFKTLLENKTELVTSIEVISEVVNRLLRIAFDVYKSENNTDVSFKNFRNSEQGKEKQKEVYDLLRDVILKTIKLKNISLTNKDLIELLNSKYSYCLDFTDKLIFNCCKSLNMILLTNDSDFSNCEIDIISTNPKIL